MRSAHDCAEGGLAVTLAECCFETGGIGADVSIVPARGADGGVDRLAATLFGESASRVIVTCRSGSTSPKCCDAAQTAGVPAARIGRTGGSAIRIAVDGEIAIDCAVADAEARWSTALGASLERPRSVGVGSGHHTWTSSRKNAASSASTATPRPPT